MVIWLIIGLVFLLPHLVFGIGALLERKRKREPLILTGRQRAMRKRVIMATVVIAAFFLIGCWLGVWTWASSYPLLDAISLIEAA